MEIAPQVSGFIGIFLIEITILILYGIFVRYDDEMLPTDSNTSNETLAKIEQEHKANYPRKYTNDIIVFSSVFINVSEVRTEPESPEVSFGSNFGLELWKFRFFSVYRAFFGLRIILPVQNMAGTTVFCRGVGRTFVSNENTGVY